MMILMHDLEQPMQPAALSLADEEVLSKAVEDAPWGDHLLSMLDLEEGWLDGTTGSPIKPAVAMFTHQILAFCDEHGILEPGVFPSPDGDALLEWHVENRRITTIDIELVEASDGEPEVRWTAYDYVEDPRHEIYRDYSRDSAMELVWFLTEVAPRRGIMPQGLPPEEDAA